jgi:NAD(P)-dependent dehydrogenase (short-subunit alcohol dehydrogenase family)
MIDRLFDVSQEIVFITGVSGQLGSEYAKAFIERGAKVLGLDVALSKTSDHLNRNHHDFFKFIPGDVTNKASLQAALVQAQASFGTPTVLINNAAIDSPPSAPAEENGPFEDYPEASWDKVVDVNLKGVYLCCQVFGSAMAKANKGAIVNVASIYGMVSPDQNIYEYRRKRGEVFYKPVAYSASNSGILNQTLYLAVYWAKQKVRVNSLTIAGVYNNQDHEFIDAYCSRIPIGRMANPNEYIGSVMFLTSQGSLYMTGHNLVVDGGWTAI